MKTVWNYYFEVEQPVKYFYYSSHMWRQIFICNFIICYHLNARKQYKPAMESIHNIKFQCSKYMQSLFIFDNLSLEFPYLDSFHWQSLEVLYIYQAWNAMHAFILRFYVPLGTTRWEFANNGGTLCKLNEAASTLRNDKDAIPGLILGLHPANERRRYFVTTSLIGRAQA